VEINKTLSGSRFVQGALIRVNHVDCLVFGFEDEHECRGDDLHLMFLFHRALETLADLEDAFELYRDKADLLVRIHSECLLGDAFNSTVCDCRKQLEYSISAISERGEGIILYMRQEGRGIGLRAKLSALALQEGFVHGKRLSRKLTPDQANVALDLPIDAREYTSACAIIQALGIASVVMITGNMQKVEALRRRGLAVSYIDIPRTGRTDERESLELKEKATRSYRYETL